jgi:hypothetical protein
VGTSFPGFAALANKAGLRVTEQESVRATD